MLEHQRLCKRSIWTINLTAFMKAMVLTSQPLRSLSNFGQNLPQGSNSVHSRIALSLKYSSFMDTLRNTKRYFQLPSDEQDDRGPVTTNVTAPHKYATYSHTIQLLLTAYVICLHFIIVFLGAIIFSQYLSQEDIRIDRKILLLSSELRTSPSAFSSELTFIINLHDSIRAEFYLL